ncbi:prephenate dehydrogenase/arogenate dehydrogenase family protein [Candidatus Woesearchaeota archaeon]|nr:prephenate dehydrogenase/arogenate dehydrogenase family protein [Candidatus Woesearchaeota archaeon]
MKPQIISIVGGRGKMGSLFAEAFHGEGYTVLVSNEDNTDNTALAQLGDVVIVSVPIDKTEEVVREIGPYVRKEALLTDFTSVKTQPVAAMAQYSQAEIIGGHPLFGPNVNLQDQNMILCPARGETYGLWYKTVLESLGLIVTFMTPEEHDKAMAAVQCLTHISNISFAYALTKMKNIPAPEGLTTPLHTLNIYAISRILSQDPSLYAGIQTANPFAKEAVQMYGDAVKEISALVLEQKKGALEELLGSLQDQFRDYLVRKKDVD